MQCCIIKCGKALLGYVTDDQLCGAQAEVSTRAELDDGWCVPGKVAVFEVYVKEGYY